MQQKVLLKGPSVFVGSIMITEVGEPIPTGSVELYTYQNQQTLDLYSNQSGYGIKNISSHALAQDDSIYVYALCFKDNAYVQTIKLSSIDYYVNSQTYIEYSTVSQTTRIGGIPDLRPSELQFRIMQENQLIYNYKDVEIPTGTNQFVLITHNQSTYFRNDLLTYGTVYSIDQLVEYFESHN